jgi:hypothetical protein
VGCIEEAKSFESVSEIEDNSDVDKLGWDVTNIETVMAEEAIWRVPVYSVVACFTSRTDCKKYAEIIANKFAIPVTGGKKEKKKKLRAAQSMTEEEDDDDDNLKIENFDKLVIE